MPPSGVTYVSTAVSKIESRKPALDQLVTEMQAAKDVYLLRIQDHQGNILSKTRIWFSTMLTDQAPKWLIAALAGNLLLKIGSSMAILKRDLIILLFNEHWERSVLTDILLSFTSTSYQQPRSKFDVHHSMVASRISDHSRSHSRISHTSHIYGTTFQFRNGYLLANQSECFR